MFLEAAREHFGVPIVVTSGARCRKHQMEVNPDAPSSRHIVDKDNDWTSDAVDFKVLGVNESKVRAYINRLPYRNLLGVGKYVGRTHVDTRGVRARW